MHLLKKKDIQFAVASSSELTCIVDCIATLHIIKAALPIFPKQDSLIDLRAVVLNTIQGLENLGKRLNVEKQEYKKAK